MKVAAMGGQLKVFVKLVETRSMNLKSLEMIKLERMDKTSSRNHHQSPTSRHAFRDRHPSNV